MLPHVLQVHATASNPHPIDWYKASAPLRILLLTAVPSAALATLTPVALIANRRRIFRFALGALAGNIALNLLLVPSFGLGLGASGAALAFLTTEAILAVVLWSTLPGRLPAVAPSPRAVGGVGAIEPA